MKIAYITWVFPSLSQTFVDNQVISLIESGQEVFFFCMREGNDQILNNSINSFEKVLENYPGILNIVTWQALRKIIESEPKILLITLRYLLPWVFLPGQMIRLLYLLPRTYYFTYLCKKNHVEHIHCDFLGLHVVTGQIISQVLNIGISARVHTLIDGGSKKRLKLLIKNIKIFIVNSQATKNSLITRAGKRLSTVIIPQAVNIKLFNSVPQIQIPCNTIIGIGRLDKKKGFNYLINAVNILISKNINVKCIIVGGGKQKAKLDNLIIKNKLADYIILTGPLQQTQILELLGSSCCLVVPSLSEGLPTVIVEAMAAGRPVIATSVGAIEELVINYQNGFLVPRCAPIALANAIEKLLADPVLTLKMGAQAREFINEYYDLNKNTKKLIASIESTFVK